MRRVRLTRTLVLAVVVAGIVAGVGIQSAQAQSDTVYRWGGYKSAGVYVPEHQARPTVVPGLSGVTALAAANSRQLRPVVQRSGVGLGQQRERAVGQRVEGAPPAGPGTRPIPARSRHHGHRGGRPNGLRRGLVGAGLVVGLERTGGTVLGRPPHPCDAHLGPRAFEPGGGGGRRGQRGVADRLRCRLHLRYPADGDRRDPRPGQRPARR